MHISGLIKLPRKKHKLMKNYSNFCSQMAHHFLGLGKVLTLGDLPDLQTSKKTRKSWAKVFFPKKCVNWHESEFATKQRKHI